MKGIVFNIFQDFIDKNAGEEAWELTLNEVQMEEEVFVAPLTYPDQKFLMLLEAALEINHLEFHTTVRSFGVFAFSQLALKYPDVVNPYNTPEELLLSLDSIIHVEVRKMLADSSPPQFKISRSENGLTIEYKSDRQLCFFAEGLLEGCAKYFNKKLEFKKSKCLLVGDDLCQYEVTFK